MKLPFLKTSKWPVIREDEERIANPSYDTQLQDHLVDEIFEALEAKDHSRLKESVVALIQNILSEESGDDGQV